MNNKLKILAFSFLLFSVKFSSAQTQVMQICLPTSSGCIPVNNSTPFPISTNVPAAVPTINASQIIITGGVFQQVLGTNTNRKSLTIINSNSNGDKCYLFIGGSVASINKSIPLLEYSQYARNSGYIPQDPIQVTCDTSGDILYVDYE